MHTKKQAAERHTLSILVDNEAGILARIAGMFTSRGSNIESLTVADVTENHAVSRITIVTKATPEVIEQIIHQLDRSEEHTSELQSLMRISYAVFCLKKKQTQAQTV